MTLEVIPVLGLPEVEPANDLARLLADALGDDGLRDGDVVAVTQKVVSKAESRLVPDDEGKEAWVGRETRRVVARREGLVIAETHHGFVCANAGIDASNVPLGFLTLLPEDPDASAGRIRDGLQRLTGRSVGVVVTDTFGRPWRRGLLDVAIGCAGIPALLDLRGTKDAQGRLLEATVIAAADQVAAAAGIVMGKAEGVPAAIVRGLDLPAPPGRATDLVRPAAEDLFREGPLQAISGRRSIRRFGEGKIPRPALLEAVSAALTAPVPHASRHRTRPWLWIFVDSKPARRRLLAAMGAAWRRDLQSDGVPEDAVDRRVARSEAFLGTAQVLAVPNLTLENADSYPDERRRLAEREMFLLATGAAVENFMLALHAQGYGSCWVSSTLFCKEEVRDALDLGEEWLPMGSVAAGRRAEEAEPPPRPPLDPGTQLRTL